MSSHKSADLGREVRVAEDEFLRARGVVFAPLEEAERHAERPVVGQEVVEEGVQLMQFQPVWL